MADINLHPATDSTSTAHADALGTATAGQEAAASRAKLSEQASLQPETNSAHLDKPPVKADEGIHWGHIAKDVGIGYGAIVGGIALTAGLIYGAGKFRLAFLPAAKPFASFVENELGAIRPAEWEELIAAGSRTADPLRTLIQMPHYGGQYADAVHMEKIIAAARDEVLSGKIQTADRLEDAISCNYLGSWHARVTKFDEQSGTFVNALRKESKFRLTGPKQYPYLEKLQDLGWFGRRDEVELGGQNYYVGSVRKRFGALQFVMPKDKTFEKAADQRLEELFTENLASRDLPQTPENLQASLERAGESEWLRARVWRYRRGTSGISQLNARTWLELGGIDSGRFAKGIDPNMEALTTPSMSEYKAKYPTFFQTPPKYF
ncbi:MAG TPA: hypothetical protein V6C81_28795 [Planktothrix sp.]|jgi:hypothetical protein